MSHGSAQRSERGVRRLSLNGRPSLPAADHVRGDRCQSAVPFDTSGAADFHCLFAAGTELLLALSV